MELAESDSEDEELDAVLCQIGAQLVRNDCNRTPMYYEEVVARYFDYEFSAFFGYPETRLRHSSGASSRRPFSQDRGKDALKSQRRKLA
ncbi:hypothetical protein MTO96_024455 [Rhipicephalus appendiculatus]